MPFTARNARYLRISAHSVLPLYIYLDDKHVDWMSDYTLQRVLADLKPKIEPKLRLESTSTSESSTSLKKASLDTHADTYQFAYFFRKSEPHAVLIKSRNFVPAPVPVFPTVPPTGARSSAQLKRKAGIPSNTAQGTEGPSKRSRTERKNVPVNGDPDTTESFEQGEHYPAASEGGKPRRSGRKKSLVAGGYKAPEEREDSDIEMTGQEVNVDDSYALEEDDGGTSSDEGYELADVEGSVASPLQESGQHPTGILDVDADEEKPKMNLTVSYQGFTIHDVCLCLVIEPRPPLQGASQRASRAPSLGLSEARMAGVAPMDGSESRPTPVSSRERTPLFLPETDPRRSLTPAPLPTRILPPVPLFNDTMESQIENEENEGGMIAFSQVLKSVSDGGAGSTGEDEDEGDVFLGDADERRGGL